MGTSGPRPEGEVEMMLDTPPYTYLLIVEKDEASVKSSEDLLETTLSDRGGLHIDETIVGLSISQWLPCPLAIWNLFFGMAIF